MSTTMVTGGLGYVGRHLVAHLARDGDRVVSLNRDFADSDDPRVVCVQGELFDVPRLVRRSRSTAWSGSSTPPRCRTRSCRSTSRSRRSRRTSTAPSTCSRPPASRAYAAS